MKRVLFFLLALAGQGPLDPALLLKPPADAWASYHGDYTGRHYSPLKQIDVSNAHALSMAWFFKTTGSTDNAIVSGADVPAGAGRGGGAPAATGPLIKAIPLMVNGILYFTGPNHVYAVDARTARLRWHYYWRGRTAIGNRGVAMYKNSILALMPDNTVVSLDAADHRIVGRCRRPEMPRQRQRVRVRGVDLLERAVMPSGVVAVIRRPGVGRRLEQQRRVERPLPRLQGYGGQGGEHEGHTHLHFSVTRYAVRSCMFLSVSVRM